MRDENKPNPPVVNEGLDINGFPETGCADLGRILDPKACAELRQWIDERRPMVTSIFYQTDEEFRDKGRWHHYAPGSTDHNLLLTEGLDLGFIEENERFKRYAEALVGPGYQIMKKSVIRLVPSGVIPKWIMDYVCDVGRPNLNPFVHDEFQDVQYFLATDFHQDKTRPDSNFVTVYMYLDEVDPTYSALHILKGSHKLGLTHYPHLLRRSHADRRYWFYSDFNGNHEKCEEIVMTGKAGSVLCFHCLTLHGSRPNNSHNPRVSLRYLLAKGPNCREDALLDQANRLVYGPHRVARTRFDIAPDGSYLRTGSSLLSYD